MNLSLPMHLANNYTNQSQVARVTTEAWVVENILCPNCGGSLKEYSSNTKSKDVFCISCKEEYQVKSSKNRFSNKIVGAEYSTTLRSIESGQHPSLMLLHYSQQNMEVVDVQIIHRSCITASSIIPRQPLGPNARRAGWQGCMIDLDKIPSTVRLFIIENGKEQSAEKVKTMWQTYNSILNVKPESRGWISDVLAVVEKQSDHFTLTQVYEYAEALSALHPNNTHVHAKIRQQLQTLRDMGVIVFESRGYYGKSKSLQNG
jgi:type II restriction enzyme